MRDPEENFGNQSESIYKGSGECGRRPENGTARRKVMPFLDSFFSVGILRFDLFTRLKMLGRRFLRA